MRDGKAEVLVQPLREQRVVARRRFEFHTEPSHGLAVTRKTLEKLGTVKRRQNVLRAAFDEVVRGLSALASRNLMRLTEKKKAARL